MGLRLFSHFLFSGLPELEFLDQTLQQLEDKDESLALQAEMAASTAQCCQCLFKTSFFAQDTFSEHFVKSAREAQQQNGSAARERQLE